MRSGITRYKISPRPTPKPTESSTAEIGPLLLWPVLRSLRVFFCCFRRSFAPLTSRGAGDCLKIRNWNGLLLQPRPPEGAKDCLRERRTALRSEVPRSPNMQCSVPRSALKEFVLRSPPSITWVQFVLRKVKEPTTRKLYKRLSPHLLRVHVYAPYPRIQKLPLRDGDVLLCSTEIKLYFSIPVSKKHWAIERSFLEWLY